MISEKQSYVRFKDGSFESAIVTLPFSNENTSFGINTTFEYLKAAGYFKFVDKKPEFNKYLQKIESFKIVQIDADSATVQYTYVDLTSEEQKSLFGAEVTLDFLKNVKIDQYVQNVNSATLKRHERYPACEKVTFYLKAQEAFKAVNDSKLALSETPYLAMLTDKDIKKRNALAKSIVDNLAEHAALESQIIAKRSELEAASTIPELEAININVKSLG